MKLRSLAVIVVAIAVTAAACSSDSDDAADVIEQYVAAYNSADIDAVMAQFAEDSVITGHPTGTGLATGLAEIRALHVRDLSFGNGYTISNVETSGDTVTWDTVWGNDVGCVEGHTTVVDGDKIVSWRWGTVLTSCP